MLAQKKQRELRIKKEKLISLNELAITSNTNAYNDMLSACECDSKISNTSISS